MNLKNKKSYPHFYTVIFYFFKYIFVLILPTIQLLIFNPKGFIEKILSLGYGLLWIVLFLIVTIAKYKYTKYYCDRDFFIEKGVFIKRKVKIPRRKIHSISLKETVASGLFGAVNFEIDTIAKKNTIDFNIFFKNKVATDIVKNLLTLKEKKYSCKAGVFKTALISILWANPVTIILIAIPFIKQTGKILGDEISKRLYSGLDMTFYLISLGISPVIAGIIFITFSLFILTVLINFFRYSNFKTIFLKDTIIVNRGLIAKTKKVINLKSINAVVSSQSSFMNILGRHNLYVNVVSSDADKDEKSLIIMLETMKMVSLISSLILKSGEPCSEILKPNRKSKKSFIAFPLLCMGVTVITFIMLKKGIWYNEIIRLLLIFLTIFEVFWVSFRLFSYKKISVYMCRNSKGKILVVSSFKRFSNYVAYIPYERIQALEIKRNPFQILSNTANLKVYIYSQSGSCFLAKHLNLKELKTLLKMLKA